MNAGVGPRLVVLILAAGFSSRFGGIKALARVRGQSLLRRTLRCAAAVSREPPILVLPPRWAPLRAEWGAMPVRLVVNRRRDRGLSASLRAGLARARHAGAVLILPVDLPWLDGRELQRLVRRWRSAPRRIVARLEGGGPAIPLILPKRRFAAAALLRGDVGLRGYAASLPVRERMLVPLPSAAFDVDTREDLRRARARRAQTGDCCTRR